ncbi:MmgE/PrpD family protein [Candidatus Bipolaricaulota bacterium]|nr:MmgE/PrpD family protein [Candidatus Bipolaricaulota bacterium]
MTSRDDDQFDRVTGFIKNLSWEDIPERARWQAKMCLLDALGAGLAGTQTEISDVVSTVAEKIWPGECSTVFLGGRAGDIGAAFANGYIANALDIDDGAKYTRGHPGAQIIPTALAISEKLDKTGEEALVAIVVGYEIASRAGRCWHDSHDTYQACGSWGSVTCSAIAANLYGLGADEISNALGIAEYNAPNLPMTEAVESPAMVKHGMGWGPMTGIISCQLAEEGFTGTPSILYSSQYRGWIDDLGSHYVMIEDNGVTYKEYASCGWGHPAMKAAKQLQRDHDLDFREIEKIWVKGFHETACLHITEPSSEEEAQFSVAWPLAVLLVYGEVGPDQMVKSALEDEHVGELVDKIEVLESKKLNDLANTTDRGEDRVGRWVGSVEMQLEGGRRVESGITSIDLGSKDEWTNRKLEKKFFWLVEDLLKKARAEEIVERVENLDRLSSVKELTTLLEGR